MEEVVASVQRVTTIIAEISTASREQSAGIQQVNDAVTEMDTTTQQNAALVEQSAAAAESMQQQAAALDEMIKTFKLEHGRAPTPAKAAAATARHGSAKPALAAPSYPR
jgi:methyl-accepting chemotaxis protein